MKQRRGGFTLIELMVVIAIIGILVALLMPAVQSAREAARRTQCKSRLKQFALALHNYHDSHSILPPGSLNIGSAFRPFSGWGWCAMALPELDQAPLYYSIDFSTNNAVGPNLAISGTSIPFTLCPSDIGPQKITSRSSAGISAEIAAGNYLGVESMLSALSAIKLGDVTDGLSTTFFHGESVYVFDGTVDSESTSSWCGKITFANEWTNNSIPHFHTSNSAGINRSVFASRHPGGAQFAFGDGSVSFLNENMDRDIYAALGTRDGGEVISF